MTDGPTRGVPKVYGSLQRLREHTRREAQMEMARAEVERDRVQERLDALNAGVDRARAQLDPLDAEALSTYHNFRLQEALRERRETARLAQRERELETRRGHHLRSVRDELTLDALVEELNARGQEDFRRAERRQMDEIAGRRKAGS